MISLSDAADRIRRGELVAFPTETVYGLGANALDAAAVQKIFDLKGRPSTSPLIVHVSTIEMARRYALEWPAEAEELARSYWPGPLTLVLKKSPQIPDIVTAGLPTVGLRVPAHELAMRLINEAGVPIAAPSANRFMELSPTTAAHVREAFGDVVPVLDGGPTQIGIESTVVSLVGGKIKLLRPGMISFGEIKLLKIDGGAHPAPGMHARHYSPRTPLILVDGPAGLPDRRGAYVWWKRSGLTSRSLRMPKDAAQYAARLYSALHEVDRERWPWIAVEKPPEKPEWSGIWDRLQRAAGQGNSTVT
jgi:L-threonylcarbamoyladenylate synthase